LGAFFSNWGQMGTNVLVEFDIFFNLGHSFQILGAIGGSNVFVEFENVFFIRANWGQMGATGDKCFSGI